MVRKKNRYLVVRIHYKDNKNYLDVCEYDIKTAVRNSVRELYGDYGTATFCNRLFIKYTNPYTNIFFLQCDRDYHIEVRTAVTFVKTIRQNECLLTCIHVTATIKSAEQYLLEQNKKEMRGIYNRCNNPVEKRKIKQLLDNLNITSTVFEDTTVDDT